MDVWELQIGLLLGFFFPLQVCKRLNICLQVGVFYLEEIATQGCLLYPDLSLEKISILWVLLEVQMSHVIESGWRHGCLKSTGPKILLLKGAENALGN